VNLMKPLPEIFAIQSAGIRPSRNAESPLLLARGFYCKTRRRLCVCVAARLIQLLRS
jgi:hypothetical protein